MRVHTDDEIYRVDAVWHGPPKATLPWRARYVAWGIGLVVFLLVLGIERQLGIGFGFFSTAWALVISIMITRAVGKRISHERPLKAVMAMWLKELLTPRVRRKGVGGAASAANIRVSATRPRRSQLAVRSGRKGRRGKEKHHATTPPRRP